MANQPGKESGLDLARTNLPPPRPAPRLYLATPDVDDPARSSSRAARPARRRRRRGGAAAAEGDRPAHHDLAHQGAGAADPERGRRAAARRPCRTGRTRRRRRRAPARHRRAERGAAIAQARSHRRSRRADDAAPFHGCGRDRRGLRAVRRARRKGQRPSSQAIAERLDWWAELFEPPCVGFAMSLEEAHEFAASGADFVLVGDFIWADPRGAKAALVEIDAAIKKAHAAALAGKICGSRARLAPDMKLPRITILATLLLTAPAAAQLQITPPVATPSPSAEKTRTSRRPRRPASPRRRKRRRPPNPQRRPSLQRPQACSGRDRDPGAAVRQSQRRPGVRRLSARPVQDRLRTRHRPRQTTAMPRR